IGALFHDAAHTDSDIGIEGHFFDLGNFAMPVEEVKAAHLIGAIVQTVAGSDASVVDLLVEPFGAVDGSVNLADVFARRVFALHTGDRLRHRFGVFNGAGVVAVDADPVHVAAHLHLFLADDGDVVFGLTSDGAGVATDAGGKVDGHAPLVALIPNHLRVKAHGSGVLDEFFHHFRILGELGERAFDYRTAALHRVLSLGRDELLAAIGWIKRQIGRNIVSACGAQREAVVADSFTHASAVLAAVAEQNGDGIVGVTGLNANGHFDDETAAFQIHDLAIGERKPFHRGVAH